MASHIMDNKIYTSMYSWAELGYRLKKNNLITVLCYNEYVKPLRLFLSAVEEDYYSRKIWLARNWS